MTLQANKVFAQLCKQSSNKRFLYYAKLKSKIAINNNNNNYENNNNKNNILLLTIIFISIVIYITHQFIFVEIV
jgi:hypothetical protein